MEMRITHPAPAVDLSATLPPCGAGRGNEFTLLMGSVLQDMITPAGQAMAIPAPSAEAARETRAESSAPPEHAGNNRPFAAYAQDDVQAAPQNTPVLPSESGSVHGSTLLSIDDSTIATEPTARASEQDYEAEQSDGSQQAGASPIPVTGASRMDHLHFQSNSSDSKLVDAIASEHSPEAFATVPTDEPTLGLLTMTAARDPRHAMALPRSLLSTVGPEEVPTPTPLAPATLADVMRPAGMTDIASPSDYADRRNNVGAIASHAHTSDIASGLRRAESTAPNSPVKRVPGDIEPLQSSPIPAHPEATGKEPELTSAVLPRSPHMHQMALPNVSSQSVSFGPTAAYNVPEPGAGHQSSVLTTDIAPQPLPSSKTVIADLSSSMGVFLRTSGGINGKTPPSGHPFAEAGELGNMELRLSADEVKSNQISRHSSTATTAAATFDAQISGQTPRDASIVIGSDEKTTGAESEAARLDGISEQRVYAPPERISQAPSASTHPTRQLGDAIIRGSANATETELVLTPEELGKVRFAINQQDGVLTISISADRPDTLALLRRHADMLSTDLAQSGLGNTTLDFGTSGRDRGRRDGHGTWVAQADSSPAELSEFQPSRPPRQHATGSGRIDLRL